MPREPQVDQVIFGTFLCSGHTCSMLRPQLNCDLILTFLIIPYIFAVQSPIPSHLEFSGNGVKFGSQFRHPLVRG